MHDRCKREASNGKQSGRTMEIQRLIGRSLRAVVDLDRLGENTLFMDCDVIDADGGTRCASITGASIALQLGLRNVLKRPNILKENVAAISVGIVRGELVLDLNYDEDSNAEVDMNVVMTESGKLVEVQGTAEGKAFSRQQLNEMIDLAEFGLKKIFTIQKEIIEKAPKVLFAHGNVPIMLVSHADIVGNDYPTEFIYEKNDSIIRANKRTLGGDDRCGGYIILEALKKINV